MKLGANLLSPFASATTGAESQAFSLHGFTHACVVAGPISWRACCGLQLVAVVDAVA
eukprot:CAMPEP_0172681404 /NCGR_PEP_ID=MMETSP1074-20121228/17429_1 /TAXON_ID=2916 /ORGANISM="Ceratium fusus, Strain PA161109" /LENGTH=56 /DNA_ID=CAMNT_0013499903 /DNA_START=238 /DNA_END=408 /DNA_ORIENTATION=-